MPADLWNRLRATVPAIMWRPWLPTMLERNGGAAYLRHYGSPRTREAFREGVPIVSYDGLVPWMDRICAGESDVLFRGRPVAYERTGGGTGDSKLIPYSSEGLRDFQSSVLPWLSGVIDAHHITGSAYFSISPATRAAETIGDIPVGLPDGAFLGETAAAVLANATAVPLNVACITDVERWRSETVKHLAAANDLELISIWSPTFLLRLLDDLGDPRLLWPHLKLVSCWAGGASKPFADALAARLPHARLQPKGLVSTETVVTVPDAQDRPRLTPYGFFEFEKEGKFYLSSELTPDSIYEVIATTGSGLYRYRTGDLVRYDGACDAVPILEFIGRGGLVSDLVGEKLTETFVAGCLTDIPGFRFVAPQPDNNGYVLIAESDVSVRIDDIERRLCANPQYDYARRLGQLQPIRLLPIDRLSDRYTQMQVEHGTRVGDVKPPALRNERRWAAVMGGRP